MHTARRLDSAPLGSTHDPAEPARSRLGRLHSAPPHGCGRNHARSKFGWSLVQAYRARRLTEKYNTVRFAQLFDFIIFCSSLRYTLASNVKLLNSVPISIYCQSKHNVDISKHSKKIKKIGWYPAESLVRKSARQQITNSSSEKVNLVWLCSNEVVFGKLATFASKVSVSKWKCFFFGNSERCRPNLSVVKERDER